MNTTHPLEVGDRVRMDTSDPEIPDLGVGTVVSTDDEFLMTGWYVEVEWDDGHRGYARRPAIASLILAP